MVQPELWAAAALMLLGAAVSFCIKCQQSATKREAQLNEQRSQLDSQQRFEVIRSHSTATRRLEKNKELENFSIARKSTEELSASYYSGYGSRDKSRYENFLAEDYLQEDAAYVEPISLGYYKSCTRLFTPPHDRTPGKQEKDEDSYSYENVIIGASQGSDPAQLFLPALCHGAGAQGLLHAQNRPGIFPLSQENACGDTSPLIPLTCWFLQQFRSFGVCISRFLVLLQPS